MRSLSAAITIKVPNYDEAREKMQEAARRAGAEVTDGRTVSALNGRRHGWLRLELPAGHLLALMASARSLGIPSAETSATSDGRSEYEILGRRVERLKKHETRLDGLLNDRRRLRGSDILFIQERLFRAETDESLLEQQQADIARRQERASVQVDFFEPAPVSRMARAQVDVAVHFSSVQRLAAASFSQLIARITTAVAYAVAYAPIWGPLLLGGLLLLRLLWVFLKRTGILRIAVNTLRRAGAVTLVLWRRLRRQVRQWQAAANAPAVPPADAGAGETKPEATTPAA